MDCTKLMYIAAGASNITHPGGTTHITAGTLVTIPGGCWCATAPMGTWQTVSMYVDTNFLHAQARWIDPICQVLRNLDLLNPIGSNIRTHKLSDGPGKNVERHLANLTNLQHSELQEFAFAAQIAEFFRLLSSLKFSDQAGSKENSPAISAARLLHQHLDRKWTISDLAREVSLSPSQLTRNFRERFGRTPAEYLSRVRADTMAGLLTETELPIAEAARNVGWADSSHASRSFKRHYGVSPSNYLRTQQLSNELPLGYTEERASSARQLVR